MSDKSGWIALVLFIGGAVGVAHLNEKPRPDYNAMAADYEPLNPDIEVSPSLQPKPQPSVPLYDPEDSKIEIPDLPVASSRPLQSYPYGYGGNGDDSDDERPEFDEYEARRAAEREMSLRGYDYRYGCTVDCSGHEAGWNYRANTGHETYGSAYGYGNSQSFGEGALAFEEAVRERVEEMQQDHELGVDFPY